MIDIKKIRFLSFFFFWIKMNYLKLNLNFWFAIKKINQSVIYKCNWTGFKVRKIQVQKLKKFREHDFDLKFVKSLEFWIWICRNFKIFRKMFSWIIKICQKWTKLHHIWRNLLKIYQILTKLIETWRNYLKIDEIWRNLTKLGYSHNWTNLNET